MADWPAAGERDPGIEADLDVVIQLVGGVRNARAEAGIAAASWLPLHVAGPLASGPTFRLLHPAIERLSRSRPLVIAARPELDIAAPGGLVVIAGDLEARIGIAREASLPERDQARLEKELADAEGFLAAANARLANADFMAKAPPAVVAGATARATELTDLVARLRARLEA